MKKNKIDFLLLAKVLLLSIAYFYISVFLGILFHFLYFGSGTGASTEKALLIGNLVFGLILSIPIFLFIYKLVFYWKSKEVIKFNSYFFSLFFIIIIECYLISLN